MRKIFTAVGIITILCFITGVWIAIFMPGVVPFWLDPHRGKAESLMRSWTARQDMDHFRKFGCVDIAILSEDEALAIAREIPRLPREHIFEQGSMIAGQFTFPLKTPPVKDLIYDSYSGHFINQRGDKFFIGYDKYKFVLMSWPRFVGY